MITIKLCPNCGSYNIALFRVVPGGIMGFEMMKGVKVNAEIVVSYCVCQDCHLIFQKPRLSDSELDKYYSSGFYRQVVTKPPEGMDKGEENRAKIDVEIIKKVVGKVNSHLDIGCGRGYLLKAVGAKVKVGTESDPKYVKVKGIKIYSDMDKISKRKFDLVTVIHVLEHVPYPLDFLKKMVNFVEKNGHLVIEVPSWKPGADRLALRIYIISNPMYLG